MEKKATLESNHKLYENFSGLYELIFKPFFLGGIRKTMKMIKEFAPENIVEVGVGTGYSLEYYPKNTNIVGVDVSDKMVQISRKRAAKIEDKNIEIYNSADLPKDALDEYASVVVSFSVITVVPDPQKFIEELKRCCKPGGHIIMIMHSRSKGLSGFFDRLMDWPTQKLFGFTLLRHISDYNLDGLQILETRPISHFLFYPYNHLILLKKT